MSPRVRYACEWTPVGIGVAARRALRAILDHDRARGNLLDLAWEPLEAVGFGRTRAEQSGDAAAWLRALRRRPSPGEVLVQHSVPGSWKQVAAELTPASQIGHSVWELEELPSVWRHQMSEAAAFWVPTEWNRRAFERAFDRPVHVVPHVATGVDPETVPMRLPDDVKVVTTISAWDWRKRPDLAIEAFCRAFQGRSDVVLAVKTTAWHNGWPGDPADVAQMIHRITERIPDAPIVYYDTGQWTDGEIAGLLERSTCTLSLTASEGWGLGAFDGATRGVPAIITGYGGQTEYLGDDDPGLLPYRMISTTHPDRDLFEPGTEWAFADVDAAIDRLRDVVDSPNSALTAFASARAAELRERYSPARVGALMVGLLDDHRADLGPITSPAPRTVSSPDLSEARPPDVVVLTPVKNAARHAEGYVDRVLSLEHPRSHLRVAVLVSDSDDGTVEAFRTAFTRLEAAGVSAEIFEQDFGYRIPDGVPRWEESIQLQRRTVLAKSRNHLLLRGLGDAEWALWIDVDVIDFPTDVITRLLAVGGDVMHPRCIGARGQEFDLNAWTDRGRHHLGDYAGEGLVELHAVGGTMLLVRADVHRDGLIWPAHRHGVANRRIRTDPQQVGRAHLGEVETEGLGILADDLGIVCWGLPDLVIRHE